MSAEDRAERQRIEDARTRNERWQGVVDELQKIATDPNETPERKRKAWDAYWETTRGSGGIGSPAPSSGRHRTNGDALATQAREEGWGGQ